MRLAAFVGALTLSACVHAPLRPAGEPQLSYLLVPPPAGSWTVHVEARFERAPTDRLVGPEVGGTLPRIELVDGDGARALPREQGAWRAPSCRERCTIRYDLDLEAVVSACHGFGCPRRVGGALLGPADMWIVRPEVMADAAIRVRVVGPDAQRLATGLRKDPSGGYAFRGHELGEAAYTAFGDLRRSKVEVPGGALEVVLLGAPLAMGDAATLTWIRNAASCVARLYGRFPADATIFVVPVEGADEVVFGRVMSLAGGSVALLFGTATRPETARSDWVVVHELSHLGAVSFVGEGHWLEEGLATYYEPILRERAGWMREQDLWAHFVREMPRGVRQPDDPASLEERDGIDATYWGGALFAFLADVRIRTETRGARGLDDVLRASLARLGDATHSARVVDFIDTGVAATGTPALREEYEELAVQGRGVDLEATWRALGVVPAADGSVTLRDDAPLAAVRKAIATGDVH